MGLAKLAADIVQKGSVLGLLSLAGYQVYQISVNVAEKKVDTQFHHTDMFNKLSSKVGEEAKRQEEGILKLPDTYEKEDNSYLSRVPDLQKQTK